MVTTVTATLINGVFHPDEQICLPDSSRVQLSFEVIEDRHQIAVNAWENIKKRISAKPLNFGDVQFTRDELHERD